MLSARSRTVRQSSKPARGHRPIVCAIAALLSTCTGGIQNGRVPTSTSTRDLPASSTSTNAPADIGRKDNGAAAMSVSSLIAAGYNVDAISKLMSIGQGGDGAACEINDSSRFISEPEVFVTPRDAYAPDQPEIGSPISLCVKSSTLSELSVRDPGGRQTTLPPGPGRGSNPGSIYVFSTTFNSVAGEYTFTGTEGDVMRFQVSIFFRESLTPRLLERRPSDLKVHPSSTVEFLVVGLRAESVAGLYRRIVPPTPGIDRYALLATIEPNVDGRGRARIVVLLDSVKSGDCLALHVDPPKPGREDGGLSAYPVQYSTLCIE